MNKFGSNTSRVPIRRSIFAPIIRRLLIVTTILGFSFSAQAWRFGGDDVGNGGGLAEKNILGALANLEFYSKLCLDADVCRLTSRERKILSDILVSLPKAKQNTDLIVFGSERQSPGTFIIDGEPKVARTGSTVGHPIYINIDMLYSVNTIKKIEPISLAQAVAILIHELGHHVSKATHSELDLLGVKVSMLLQNRIQSTPVLPWSQDIEANVIQGSAVESFPQILLTIGDEIWDLTKNFQASISCPVFTVPIPLLPFPDLQFGKKEPLGTVYHNVHWDRAGDNEGQGSYRIVGNVSHVCPTGTNSLSLVNSFKVRIGFDTVMQGPKPVLVDRSIRVEQTYEPWYKLVLFKF